MIKIDYMDRLIQLYVEDKKSIPQCSVILNKSKSAIRAQLKNKGVLRSKIEGVCLRRDILGKHLIGKKRYFTEEHRNKMSLARKNKKHNGYSLKPNGYYECTNGENKFRAVHRVVVEEHYGIKLDRSQIIHHKNGIRTDNRIENLKIMDKKSHSKLHAVNREIIRDKNNGRILTYKNNQYGE